MLSSWEGKKWTDVAGAAGIRDCFLEGSVSRALRNRRDLFSWVFMQGHCHPASESSPCVLMSFLP